MAYRITYGEGTIQKRTVKVPTLRWKRLMMGIVVSVLAVTLAIPTGRLWLRDLLLPGDEQITAAALESMVEDLRCGEPVGEAVETFCKGILAGGA
jgi:hypothetical protein